MAITRVSLSGVSNIVKYDDILANNNPIANYWITTLYYADPTGSNINIYDITTDSSNNIYLSGITNYGGTAKLVVWKISPQSVILSANTYTSSTGTLAYPRATYVDSSGNVYYAASRTQTIDGTQGIFVAKVNSSNVSQWSTKGQINSNYFWSVVGLSLIHI